MCYLPVGWSVLGIIVPASQFHFAVLKKRVASLLSLIKAILRKNCNFALDKTGKKNNPIFRLDCHGNPVIKFCLPVVRVGLGYLCEDIQFHQPHSSSRGTREVASSYVRVHPTQTSSDYL